MSIVVVGSIAFDTIRTPFGFRERSLGGAANYFAVAASYFSKVKMVGVVGQDFPKSHLDFLQKKNIDILGIERAQGDSFHWQGEYEYDLNCAKTIKTELNVFENFCPNLPEEYKHASTIFLANIDPALQIHVLKQMKSPKISALDTMNFWIERKKSALIEAISMVNILFINDAEIRSLTGEFNVAKAAKSALRMGPKIVVVKRGEYGAVMFAQEREAFFVPAFLVEEVFDPTGAGDSFAGGFLGALDGQELSFSALKEALLTGTVMSSFVIESFSFDRLMNLTDKDICLRKEKLKNMFYL